MVINKYSRVFAGVFGRIPWSDTIFLEYPSTCEHAYNFFALKTYHVNAKLPCTEKNNENKFI